MTTDYKWTGTGFFFFEMLTVGGFLLPGTGFSLEMLGLTPETPGAVFDLWILVLPLTFGNAADFDEPSFKFGSFLLVVAEVGFEVEGLILFLDEAVPSAFTSMATSSTNLLASSWSILDADNKSATERRKMIRKKYIWKLSTSALWNLNL